ncbi:MAG: phosphatidate cytidylyltransferase [Treponema sp.]|nr:phosphatidate cytidylyltransferase [Treponema sp.]
MNKTGKRLLTFFIGIPVVLAIVFFDYMNHLALQITIGVFAIVAGNEFYNMLSPKMSLFSKKVVLILTASLPYVCYLFILSGMSLELTPWFFICECLILMGLESFHAKTFENSISKIAGSSLIIFYCGFLITFLSRLTSLPNSRYIVSLFLIIVFICDSLAWFFGILFGKGTRGLIAASPNKSLVGFIGGVLSAIAASILFKILFPSIFTTSYLNLGLIGLFTSLASIVGDLIESVFKRACGVKDSGNIIPGRGGVLDSIDSILIASPVFYICYHFLF